MNGMIWWDDTCERGKGDMATLNAEHINPFLMAAKKVLQDMCFVEVSIQKPSL